MSLFRLLTPFVCIAAIFCSCARLPRQTFPRSNSESDLETTRSDTVRININTAPAGELEKLPGIGKELGERIVAHREQYGAFRRAEHLMMVRGISERKFRQLRPLVRVD